MRDSAKILLVLAVAVAAVLGQDDDSDKSDKDEKGGEEEEECPEYVCPEQHGSFADPCECRRFYKCNHGVPTRLLCPSSKWKRIVNDGPWCRDALQYQALHKLCEYDVKKF